MADNQERVESDQLIATHDETLQDDDNSLQSDSFVLLLAQAAPELFISTPKEPEKTELVEIHVATTAKRFPAKEGLAHSSTESELAEAVDKNVAVTWINSEYYQAEFTVPLSGEKGPELVQKSNPEFIETATRIERADSEEQQAIVRQDFEQQNNVHAVALGERVELDDDNEPIPDIPEINLNKSKVVQHYFSDNQIIETQDKHVNLSVPPTMLIKRFLNDTPSEGNEHEADNDFNLKTTITDPFDLPSLKNVLSPELEHLEAINTVESKQPIVMGQDLISSASNNLISFSKNNDRPDLVRGTSFSIPADINTPQWSTQFSEQLLWLGQQGINNATIKIHPEELGPLEIRINVVNNVASVNIVSHSQHVSDIIEQSVSRLELMMAEQGLNLSEFNVNSDAGTGTRQFEQRHQQAQNEFQVHAEIEEDAATTPLKTKVTGTIDYFA